VRSPKPTPLDSQVKHLATELINRSIGRERYLLGITGVPGAGKSTLAQGIAEAINDLLSADNTIVVPMDGFHLPNHILAARDLQSRKGAPETFDAQTFARTLRSLRAHAELPIACPIYDRRIHDPIENAITVESRHRLVIVEGNYLLLATPSWSGLRSLLDEVWFLHIEEHVARERLLLRHITGGMTETEAIAQIERVDTPNARLINETRTRADRIVPVS